MFACPKSSFKFTTINADDMTTVISKLNPRKATSCDGKSAKLLMCASPAAAGPLTSVFNSCIGCDTFQLLVNW